LSGLKLPARLRMDGARAAWAQMSPALRAEAAQVLAAAGRQCSEQGATLKLDDAPEKLRELARVYGVSELLWPPAAAA